MPHWYQLPSASALAGLRTSADGLTPPEAGRCLGEHGPIVLRVGARRTALGILLGQFTDFMILVLLAAAVISGLIGDVADTIAIVAIVLLKAVIGLVQEHRAERAMEALKAMAAPTAIVTRGGRR